MSTKWYVVTRRRPCGPFTVEEIRHLLETGKISAESRCRRCGKGESHPFLTVHELLNRHGCPPRPSIPPQSQDRRAQPGDDIRQLVALTLIPGSPEPAGAPESSPPSSARPNIRPSTPCWHVLSTIEDDRRYGPFSLEDLKAMFLAGRIFEGQKITRRRSDGSWGKWLLSDVFAAAEKMFAPEEFALNPQPRERRAPEPDPLSCFDPSVRTPTRQRGIAFRRRLSRQIVALLAAPAFWHTLGYASVLAAGFAAGMAFFSQDISFAPRLRRNLIGSSCIRMATTGHALSQLRPGQWVNLTTVFVSEIPLACAPCQTRGVLPDGTQIKLRSRTQTPWLVKRQSGDFQFNVCAQVESRRGSIPTLEVESLSTSR